MKKKSSIVKLSIIGVLIAIGLVLSFCSFNPGFSNYKSFASSIKLGLDVNGGVYAVFEADESESDFDSKMLDTRDSLLELLVAKGYTGAIVTREGTDKLRVEVPNTTDPQNLFTYLGQPATLSISTQSGKEEILSSKHIVDAGYSYYSSGYVVTLGLNKAGKKILNNNANETLSVITTVGNTPTTQQGQIVNGILIITGLSSPTAADNLANQLMSGTFGVELSFVESAEISSPLGGNAAKWALIAGLISLVLITVFMVYMYRAFGLVSLINLLIQLVLTLFFLAVFPWIQLTLPAIIGVFLGFAIMLNGNIFIFEKIKKEYLNGKSILSSTHYGFKKSFWSVIDGNVIAALIAIVFWAFPTGTLSAFGTTLLVSALFSTFCSLFVTRKIIKYLLAINDKKPAFYNLKRGLEFAGLGADETATEVQKQIDFELSERVRFAKEKEGDKSIDIDNGGLQGKNV